jgi:uroporphyrinogen-III synthase
LNRPLLLLTRPAEEVGRTAAAAQEAGFDTLAAPLLDILPLRFAVPDGAFDALLFTSARAPEIVAAAAPQLLSLPAGAVGARTAEVAEAAGFRVGPVGERDGTAILAAMAAGGVRRVLHLAGEATAPITVPPGVELVRVPVYAAERAGSLAPEAVFALRNDAVFATLLFSARTARHFRRLVEDAGLSVERLRIVALSPAVAEAAGQGWAATAVADQPDLPAHLSAAHALWQGVRDARPSDR